MRSAQTIRFAPHPIKSRHICVVTETYPPEINGVSFTLARLIQGLRLLGHYVSIVRPRQPDRPAATLDIDSTETLLPSVPLPGYSGLRFGLPAGRALREQWSDNRPDVIYIATEGPLGWSALRAALDLDLTVFSGFHTSFDRYSHYYHLGWLQPWIARYLCKFHNRTHGTLVASPDLRDELCAMGIKNVSILGRGVDGELFNPARRSASVRHAWRVSDNDIVALYVGRVAAEKNIALAIKAYHAMRQVESGAKFVLVGDGPLRASLQEQHPDVIFCGAQQGEELARTYASADVFLFPSETETFGNVTLEAMASGLVVVAFDYAAARMHITAGQSGVLVPFGDSSGFVAAAAKLARAPQSLFHIRQQARSYATRLDWQHIIHRFATLLLDGIEDEARERLPADVLDALPAG
ncbi:MAG TPA: glycosyltransferase family 1 protein [Candidatus Binatia bacterium]